MKLSPVTAFAFGMFAIGYTAGGCYTPQPEPSPTVAELQAEIEQLKTANARLEWELKQATEEMPDYPRQTSP